MYLTGRKRKRKEKIDDLDSETLKYIYFQKRKLGDCPISGGSDLIIKMPCCDQEIGLKSFCRLSFAEKFCCYCRSKQIQITLEQRTEFIHFKSEDLTFEFDNLPVVLSGLLLDYLKKLFSAAETLTGIIDMIYGTLKFTKDYFEKITRYHQYININVEYASSIKLEEFFSQYLDNMINLVLRDTKAILTDNYASEDVAVLIILEQCRVKIHKSLNEEFVSLYKSSMIKMLSNRIKDTILDYMKQK